jgi:hypothetical protein
MRISSSLSAICFIGKRTDALEVRFRNIRLKELK